MSAAAPPAPAAALDGPPAGSPQVRAAAAARWGLPVVGAVPVAAFLVVAGLRLTFPYDLQWMEGSSVDLAARVAEGLALYTAPSLDHAAWPYPPLYYWVTGGLSALVGPGYLPLRLVSAVSFLVAAGALAVIVVRQTGVVAAGVVAAGTLAATYQLSGTWADTGRVDSLVLALLLVAVAAGLRATTWRGAVLVGLLLGAAVLTKQTALVVAVPYLAALWWRTRGTRGDTGTAAAATVAAAVPVAAVAAVEQVRSGGWFAEIVVRQLPGHGVVPGKVLGFWFADLALPLAGVVIVAAWWAVLRSRSGAPLRWRPALTDPLVVAAAGLLAAGWAGRLHAGGYLNVLMPAHAALALLAGVAVGDLWRRGLLAPRVNAGVVTMVLALQLGLLAVPWTRPVPTAEDRAAGDRFVAAVAATEGPVVVLGHPHYAVLAGKPPMAHVLGLVDVRDGGSSRGREALAASLPGALDGVDVVVLDEVSDGEVLGPALDGFVVVSTRAVPGDGLFTVTDLPRRPQVVLVRASRPGAAAAWEDTVTGPVVVPAPSRGISR